MLSGILFFYMGYQKGCRSIRLWWKCLLEFTVYSVGMIHLVHLIMLGIQTAGNSNILEIVQLLLTEGMLLLFLFLNQNMFVKSPPKKDAEAITHFSDGILTVAFLLLLFLMLQNWQKAKQWEAFLFQTGYLAVFFLLQYLTGRQQQLLDRELRKAAVSRNEQPEGEYLKNVDRQYQRTRELWHDLKNHIGVLQILAQEQKNEELEGYLVSFRQDVESRMVPVKTGCSPVDALLGDKLYEARKMGIAVSLQLCDLSALKIPSIDMCVILGNLLDNAMEACEKLPGDKWIQLGMKQQENFYYLKLVNGAPDEDMNRNGTLCRSTKKGMENGVGHGLGLRSVERIAHQYGGSVVTDAGNGRFTVIVRMSEANL